MTTRPGRGWQHRHVSANGARFHVVEVGEGPLVLFLHGFPEFWWAWRHQLDAVADAGFRAAAMDLRGYGGSDKPPRGYDPQTLAADVAGVIASMGTNDAVVIGHGWGGYVAWAVASRHPQLTRGLAVISAPHPRALLTWRHRPPRAAVAHLLAMQVPWLPERRIMRGDYISRHLTGWAAPGASFPEADDIGRYRDALSQWPSPHCALEFHRWLFRSRVRADGRSFARLMRTRITAPVLQVTGVLSPAISPAAVSASTRYVAGPHTTVHLRCGHFPHEEVPDELTQTVVAWLSDCAVSGVDSGG